MWSLLFLPFVIGLYVWGIFLAVEFLIVPVVWVFNPTAAISLAGFILLMNTVYILFNKKDEYRMHNGIVNMCSLLIVWEFFLFYSFLHKPQMETEKGFFSEVHESAQKDISWEKFVQEKKALFKTDESTSQQD